MTNWVPAEIENKFGTISCGMVCGDLLELDVSREKEIVAEFERHGYHCIRDDNLIGKACGF
jgi:hypothetical protein